MLDLTDTGRRAVREVTANRISVLATVMDDWTPHDRQAFLILLEHFNSGTPPRCVG